MSKSFSHKHIFNDKFLLIMDFDGTIADTFKLHEEAFKITLADYPIEFDYKKYAGQKTIQAIRNAFHESDISLNDYQLAELSNIKQRNVRNLIKEKNSLSALPGVEDFLNWAKSRFELIIASSGSRGTVDLSLKSLGFKHFFQYVICSEDVKESKPSPEIFLKALSLSAFSKEQSLIFEDSDSGIAAAKASQIPFIDVRCLPFTTLNKSISKS